jgi:hypothetical protein
MAKAAAAIQITGLKELRSALRKASDEFPDKIKEMNFIIVDSVLLPEVKAEASSLVITTWNGKTFHLNQAAIDSFRALRQQKSAILAIGGAKTPYVAGDEFGSAGGKTAKGGHTSQFGGWRGNGPGGGYFVWPSIRAKIPEIQSKYMELLDAMLAGPFPDKG